MDRVLVVGTKDVMESVIKVLHEMDVLHVEDYVEEGSYFHMGKPMKSATSLSEKLLKLRSIRSYLGTREQLLSKEKSERVIQDIDENLSVLETTLTGKMSEKSAFESELKELTRKKDMLAPYEALGLPMDLLYGYESISAFVGTMPQDAEPLVKAITPDYELFSAPYEKGTVIALFVPKAVSAKVSEALMKSDFLEIEPLRESGMPADLDRAITDRQAELMKKVSALTADIKALNQKYAQFILASEELLTIETQKAEAPIKFATSENVFVIDGWVPANEFKRLEETLVKATDDKVYVTTIEPEPEAYKEDTEQHVTEHHEIDAPVKYANPKWAYSLQAFIDLYARPKYNEVDPTMLFLFGFPLFYGFILGDIGYGILIFLIALFLKRKLKSSDGWQILSTVGMICAASSVFFGVLFGEFMGFPITEYISGLYPTGIYLGPIGPFSLPLERLLPGGFEHGSYVFGIKDLLVFTCLVGVAQITLGLILGFRNELMQHGLKTAILHKFSWIFLLLGGVCMVWYVFPLMMAGTIGALDATNLLFLSGAIMFVVGLVLLLMGEGVTGILEVPGLLSNTLSYTRLLAVGMSSVGIAFAVNTMTGMLADAGVIGMIGAVVVFLLGHTINLALGILAPGLHALRLHYVEFFQKFYKGGGKIYNPFGYIRKYTEE
jgi:V/A-type H+-transporting ATPase subunit I